MAPDRGGATAILDPVPKKPWSAAIIDPIPVSGTLNAVLDGGQQVLVSATCMGAVIETEERGLVICTPISKHATSNTSSRATCKPILFNQTEEGKAPGAQNLKVQSMMLETKNVGMAVAPTTDRGNQGVAHDPAGNQVKVEYHSIAIGRPCSIPHKQAPSRCTDIKERKAPRQIGLHNSTDIEAKDGTDTCKYVNIEQLNAKQNFSQSNAYCAKFGARTQNLWRNCTDSDVWCSAEPSRNTLGKSETPASNWLRAVKPEVGCPASLDAEKSWPPLVVCRMKAETSGSLSENSPVSCVGSQETIRTLFTTNYEQKGVVLVGNMKCRPCAYTEAPYVKPELLLDEQTWPSLQKSCKHSVLHDGHGNDKKRRTLQRLVSSNFHHPGAAHTMEEQRQKAQHITPHRRFCTTEKLHIPPLLLMLNKDFIVTSPLKENLLLTLALMGKRSDVEAPESFQGQNAEGERKRKILVGQFKAFSSYLHFVLGRDATRVRTESNAGGTSTISESLSVEYFVRRFQAKDIVTEMEVEYCSFNWKKVDFICTLYGQRVGVSVTRAMSFPDPKDFSAQMAYRLLYKKLFGLVVARHGVSKRHSFSQCILHVWCETRQTAHMMQTEYDGVSQELDIADDVVMVLTVADGCHARPIFYESLLRNT